MDALAARLGRVEAGLAGLRQEVVTLQGSPVAGKELQLDPGARRSDPRHDGAVVAEWVRLFEQELEALRKRLEVSEGWEARLRQVEQGAGDCRQLAGDLDELSELMLSELRGLQGKVQVLSQSAEALPAEDLGHGPPPAAAAAASAAEPPATTGALQRRHAELCERFAGLEGQVERAGRRLERLEVELGPGGAAGGAAGPAAAPGEARRARSLVDRLEHLEHEVEAGLSPQRMAVASLRTLEETNAKVQELQRAVDAVLADGPVARSVAAAKDFEATTKEAMGSLSVLDAHRMQASLDQVMAAMEALSRQRNDDVRLMNGYLSEFYTRMREEVMQEAGSARAGSISDLRMEVSRLTAQVESLAATEMRELETRVLHESRLASEAAAACRAQLSEFKGAVARATEQGADVDVRLKGLLESSDRRAAAEARSETFALDMQRELSRLRVEIAELAAGARGGGGIEAEARLMAVRAELEAQLDRQSQDAGRRAEALQSEVRALRQQGHELGSTAGNAGLLREDVERLVHDVATLRSETARGDVELRDRVAQGEHELRAEIRSAQGLVLELAEQLRTQHRLPTGGLAEPMFGARVPRPPLTVQDGPPGGGGGGGGRASSRGGAHEAAEQDVGALLALSDSIVEWRVPGVRARARAGDARALVSAPFSVPRFAGGPSLRLKLFPLGSRRRAQPGHCSLYVSGPEGAHLQFLLRLGGAEHGPLECVFDRPDKDTGRHDFSPLEEELEADGSSVVRLTVLRAAAHGQDQGP